MGRVIIGVDPHKLSATIEVLNEGERVLGGGRFGTDRNGYRQMLTIGRRWPYRVWAVEGCDGIGRHLAQRLVADGETVLDVPAKLSARAREFSTPDTAARPTPPTPNPSPWSPSALRTWPRSASTTRWSPCEPEAGTGSLARSPDHPQGRTPGDRSGAAGFRRREALPPRGSSSLWPASSGERRRMSSSELLFGPAAPGSAPTSSCWRRRIRGSGWSSRSSPRFGTPDLPHADAAFCCGTYGRSTAIWIFSWRRVATRSTPSPLRCCVRLDRQRRSSRSLRKSRCHAGS